MEWPLSGLWLSLLAAANIVHGQEFMPRVEDSYCFLVVLILTRWNLNDLQASYCLHANHRPHRKGHFCVITLLSFSLADYASPLTLVYRGLGHTRSQLSLETVYIVIIVLPVNWERLSSQPISHTGSLFVFPSSGGIGSFAFVGGGGQEIIRHIEFLRK